MISTPSAREIQQTSSDVRVIGSHAVKLQWISILFRSPTVQSLSLIPTGSKHNFALSSQFRLKAEVNSYKKFRTENKHVQKYDCTHLHFAVTNLKCTINTSLFFFSSFEFYEQKNNIFIHNSTSF